MISAKIIADSKNQFGNRLTTLEVVMPRIILAEFNTHRMLSRNSASSRAIPFDKLVKSVEKNPFIPIKWMKNHTGMQGNQYFNDAEEPDGIAGFLKHQWLEARDNAIIKAQSLADQGLTKQIVNRLLEPFMWHTVLVSATEWENFFALRYDSHAEIHMQEVAKVMLEAMNNSIPVELKPDEWHIPYGDKMILDNENRHVSPYKNNVISWSELKDILAVKISTAMCAGLSYTVVGEDGKQLDNEKLIKRHDMLAENGHWSPFEHCAKAMTEEEYEHNAMLTTLKSDTWRRELGWCGNFRGFVQYRKMFKNENRTDKRLIIK
jgi:thymidylate synthase ThyX